MMRKRIISTLALTALVLTTTTITFASSSLIMFGDNAQRTHVNSITDGTIWSTEATITHASASGITLNGNQLHSSSTAMGDGNILYYPVSSGGTPSNNFQDNGYMVAFDMSQWSGGNPKTKWIVPVPNVSNSSPVIANGYAYLAAGQYLYKFDANGEVGKVFIGDAGTNYTYNQVVSYPLYLTAAQTGLSGDTIWITTQNGWVYGVVAGTMKIFYSHNFGQRFDGSPTLVMSGGTPFIVWTGANDEPNGANAVINGNSAVGMLFLHNITNDTATYLPSPWGISSIAAPIVTDPSGNIMWSDGNENVALDHVNSNGTVTNIWQWPQVVSGQTSWDGETAYANGQYIIPLTSNWGMGMLQ